MTTDLKPTTKRMPFDALIDRRSGLLGGVLAPRMVDHLPAPDVTPTRESLERALITLKAAFPHLKYTLDDGMGSGDRVAHCLSVTGTVEGDFIWASRTWARERQRPSSIPVDGVLSAVR